MIGTLYHHNNMCLEPAAFIYVPTYLKTIEDMVYYVLEVTSSGGKFTPKAWWESCLDNGIISAHPWNPQARDTRSNDVVVIQGKAWIYTSQTPNGVVSGFHTFTL